MELRLGWRIGADGRSVIKGRQPAQPLALPAGAALVAAMLKPEAQRRRGRRDSTTSRAEAALDRFVQLRLPPGESAKEWLERVRRWECVQSAQLPPALSLP